MVGEQIQRQGVLTKQHRENSLAQHLAGKHLRGSSTRAHPAKPGLALAQNDRLKNPHCVQERTAGSRCLKLAIFGPLVLSAMVLHAETGADAWLRYAPLPEANRVQYASLPAKVVVLSDSLLLRSAQQEMIRGVKGMLGRTLREATGQIREPSIVLGTAADIQSLVPAFKVPHEIRADGFWLTTAKVRGFDCIVITGGNDRGVLYGVFAFLSKMARVQDLTVLGAVQQPYAPIRWVDQWDNLDGRIERGYAGPSIFFDGGAVRADLTRARDYARLLASLGINGCTINNVNANPKVLEESFLLQLARVADVFRPWGVRLSISVNLRWEFANQLYKKRSCLRTFLAFLPRLGRSMAAPTAEARTLATTATTYITRGGDKRSEPTAFCRVLQAEVENGAVCAAWADDDQMSWQQAQSILKELDDE